VHPILLNKEHYLTILIARECHERVMHSGVKETDTGGTVQVLGHSSKEFHQEDLAQMHCMLPISGKAISTISSSAFACFPSEWSQTILPHWS
jgi:hypothetical protein